MQKKYVEDQVFEKLDFSNAPLSVGDYDNCSFLFCNFTAADLSHMHFSECRFQDCNFSNTKLVNTTFNDAVFDSCKLLGLHFEQCSSPLFTVRFEKSTLQFSSFYQRKMKKTSFSHCNLQDVDFTDADISQSVFDQCDLQNAKFENTQLEKADLRTAFNYSIDPDLNRIKKALFSLHGVTGLLGKYDITIE